MKVEQRVEREGNDLVLVLMAHPSGKVLGRRVWKDAAKYLVRDPLRGYIEVRVPRRAGLNIKPASDQN